MKYEYSKEIVLPYSEMDSTAHLSLMSALNYVQNMTTEYFEKMGTDNFTVKTKSNALWVITKTKIKINQRPIWKDKIWIHVNAVKLSAIRFDVEICFKDVDGKILMIVKQDYCAIDVDSRRVRKIATISFPSDLELENENYHDEYKKLKDEFEVSNFEYSQKICSPDIDFSQHTNNVAYVRFLMNTFSCEFLSSHEINDFEIHYISESREGQILEIYKKNKSDKEIEFLIKESGREIARAYMTLK